MDAHARAARRGSVVVGVEAFAHIAPIEAGRTPVSWAAVACSADGPVSYRFKEGSSPSRTAVQVRGRRYPIARREYLTRDGSFPEISRERYGYFTEPDGMGEGPFTFRMTDAAGRMIEDTDIPLSDNREKSGKSQFPPCTRQQPKARPTVDRVGFRCQAPRSSGLALFQRPHESLRWAVCPGATPARIAAARLACSRPHTKETTAT
ncbi:expansin EXLX1 family cellulose-binding protein [Sorangium sp. So ce429]